MDVYDKIESGAYAVDKTQFSWGPSREDIEELDRQEKVIDDTPLSRADRNKAMEALKAEMTRMGKERRQAYSAEENRLRKKFQADVEEDYGLDKWPDAVKQAIHGYAWDRGHSGGYSDVYAQYDELVDLVSVARDNP